MPLTGPDTFPVVTSDEVNEKSTLGGDFNKKK